MDAIIRFRKKFMSPQYTQVDGNNMVTFYDNRLKIIASKDTKRSNKSVNVLIIDKQKDRDIIYNNLETAAEFIHNDKT